MGDEQINHSKLVRKIEELLNKMLIHFNIAIIIQMSLSQKLELLKKIEIIQSYRQLKKSSNDNQQSKNEEQSN